MPLIAGVDEAGRGPLAGPVAVAAVILSEPLCIEGLKDSKQLSHVKRMALAEQIRQHAVAWSVVLVSAAEIDEINILAATMVGMKRAVEALQPVPTEVLIDGNKVPDIALSARAIVGGDKTEPAISAASILAKTTRDILMLKMHEQYGQYGFDRHKGYPTKQHIAALQEFGPCPEHRRSFAPVRRALLG